MRKKSFFYEFQINIQKGKFDMLGYGIWKYLVLEMESISKKVYVTIEQRPL